MLLLREAAPMPIESLRTPEAAFADVPGFAYVPRYADDLPGAFGLMTNVIPGG